MFKTKSALRKKFYAAMVVLVCLLVSKDNLIGQDIHFSQFYNSPLNINPALTGMFNGDTRVIGSYKDQWRNVKVPYTTFSGNYDMKVYPKKRGKGFYGVGAIFNYDNSGTSKYNITDLNLTGSYSRLINANNIITAGLLLGVASEGFSQDGLIWDQQWTGDRYDPTLSSNEQFNNVRLTYLETGAGLNYRYQKSSRTNFNLGVGAWHLNTPSASFNNITSDLPMRLSASFTGIFKIASPLDVQLHANYSAQDKYSQLLFGGLARIHINQKPGSKYALDLGASYRNTGMVIPTLALHYNQWYIGASFDINTIPFVNEHNLRRGGPEVHVMYNIINVQPLSEKKVCPIF